MAIGQIKDAINDKRDAVFTALTAAFAAAGPYTEHTVIRQFKTLQTHSNDELTQGVIMLLVDSEGQYSDRMGMIGKDGVLRLIVVYHLRVAEDDPASAVEDAEVTFIEEMKAFCRTGVTGMSLLPQEFRFSQQRNHPYGFVAGMIHAVSPRNSQS